MDNLLELFLKTPLAKRYLAGYVERGLMVVCLWLAKQISDDFAKAVEGDVAKFAIEATPLLVAALFAWIAQKRMKKTEMTITVAQANQPFVPRKEIDRQVNELMTPAVSETRTPPIRPPTA